MLAGTRYGTIERRREEHSASAPSTLPRLAPCHEVGAILLKRGGRGLDSWESNEIGTTVCAVGEEEKKKMKRFAVWCWFCWLTCQQRNAKPCSRWTKKIGIPTTPLSQLGGSHRELSKPLMILITRYQVLKSSILMLWHWVIQIITRWRWWGAGGQRGCQGVRIPVFFVHRELA